MKKTFKHIFLGLAIIGSAYVLTMVVPLAYASVTIVTPSSPDWWFDEETASGSGAFVYGPSTPPLGVGSVEFTVDSLGGEDFGTFDFAGTRLDAITSLAYSTYRSFGAGDFAASLQFDIDTDVTDANTAWQGRLVYEPYYTHSVSTGIWQTWNPFDNSTPGNWWFTGAPGNAVCPINNPCTWAKILATFPNAGIRSAGPETGALQFKAGGGWTGGFVGNVDAFSISVNGSTSTYDLELPLSVPVITSITPSSTFSNSPAFSLTVNGTGFFPSSLIEWNGLNSTTTFASSTDLIASISSSDLAVSGVFPVTVENPVPGGGISNAQMFTVLVPPANIYVINLVVNGSSSTAVPSDFTLHVKAGGVDVAGSPQSGTSTPGSPYLLSAGTYVVSEDSTTISSAYAQSFSGDCDSSGIVTLAGIDQVCTITDTANPPLPPPASAPAAAPVEVLYGGNSVPPLAVAAVPNPSVPTVAPAPVPVTTVVVPRLPNTGSSRLNPVLKASPPVLPVAVAIVPPALFDVLSEPVQPEPQNFIPFMIISVIAEMVLISSVLYLARRWRTHLILKKHI